MTAAPEVCDVAALICAVQLGDSLFPVGAFAFSAGLETAVELGVVHDAGTLTRFARGITHQGAGGDGVALLIAHRAAVRGDPAGIRAADDAVYSRKTNEEPRVQSVRMGGKLADAGAVLTDVPLLHEWRAAIGAGDTPGTFPVGLGLLCACLGVPEQAAFAVHQHGTAAMLTGAALRLMRLDHLTAQQVLRELNQHAAADYQRVRELALTDMSSFTPHLDILTAAHTRAHVRMFMS
ncbi:urease accessory protein UreF [Dactylosporangium sp. NPDC000521]|uniref:urease accessory protein UreF n=1 Tax=Dactylosporangium sp. NPDC000521 TaxID=3363975 RepID=UPI0036B4F6FB